MQPCSYSTFTQHNVSIVKKNSSTSSSRSSADVQMYYLQIPVVEKYKREKCYGLFCTKKGHPEMKNKDS